MKKEALIVADLGFGDAGKGTLVDYLVGLRGAHTVVRFNGGAQAAHRVLARDSREHVFSQFGSGTFHPGVETFLSRCMLVEPAGMCVEEKHLAKLGVFSAFERLIIDERALVTTPFQMVANRIRERSRGENRHGSCGVGVGETMNDLLEHPTEMVFVRDFFDRTRLERKLERLRELKIEQLTNEIEVNLSRLGGEEVSLLFDEPVDWFVDACETVRDKARIVDERFQEELCARDGTIVMEGAQGVLLDEWYGFHPHTTWSTTTFENTQALLSEARYTGEVTRIGATRAYATRHGAGPFVTEDADLTKLLPDACNGTDEWQGGFRVGWLDLVMLRYALSVTGGADYLAVTNLDRLDGLRARICNRYEFDGDADELKRFMRADDEGRVRDLIVDHSRDLDRQERLGALLRRCTPVTEVCGDGNELLARIEDLSVPIGITSRGPQARDKTSHQLFPTACA